MHQPADRPEPRGPHPGEVRIAGRDYVLVSKEDYEHLLKERIGPAWMSVPPAEAGLGKTLRQWRRSAGLRQVELAERAGISLETLSRIENGHRNPSLPTLQALLRALEGRKRGTGVDEPRSPD